MYSLVIGVVVHGLDRVLQGPYIFEAEDTFADVMAALPDLPAGYHYYMRSWRPEKGDFAYGWPHTTVGSVEEGRSPKYVSTEVNATIISLNFQRTDPEFRFHLFQINQRYWEAWPTSNEKQNIKSL